MVGRERPFVPWRDRHVMTKKFHTTTQNTLTMQKHLLHTDDNWSHTLIRLMLGIVLFPHGAQKLLGWFGGPGFSGAMDHLTADFGLPGVIAFLVVLIEFIAPLLLMAGLMTRAAAASVFVLFVGIIFTAHIGDGFFMNWFGQLEAGREGFEYHLLVLAMAAALLISGGGRYALDTRFAVQEGHENTKALKV